MRIEKDNIVIRSAVAADAVLFKIGGTTAALWNMRPS